MVIQNIKYLLSNMKILKVILILILFISLLSCSKTYHIDNAPKPKEPIADYENLLSKREYNNLLKLVKEIKVKYDIKIYILTIKSDNNYSLEIFSQKVDKLFGINYSDLNNKQLIIVISKHDSILINGKSPAFGKVIKDDFFKKKYNLMEEYYIRKKKFYEGFKYLLKKIKKELDRKNKAMTKGLI